MTDLTLEIKQLIIDALNLEDITTDDIVNDEPLFDEGLGLDSIDALELGMALAKKYQVKLNADSKDNKAHFYSVSSIAAFVQANQE